MKLRTLVASAASVALLSGVVAPEASAQHPEPLNGIIKQLRDAAGPQGPNLLLVPAVLSSVGIVNAVVVIILASVGAAGVSIAASS